MIFFNYKLVAVSSFFAVCTINILFSKPALSSVSCKAGTISRYSNGSLNSCLLARDIEIRIGGAIFPCKAKKYISFTEKSRFKSCTLSQDIKIRKGNSVQSCKRNYIVSVSTPEETKNLSASCYPE
ncbi:MAG: hypothetical protein SWZ49_22545 [Cyanobacteriota bacterium]|nr:hypothetical protein [Cyanobacteriota bacterium]